MSEMKIPPHWPPHWPDITDAAVRAAMAAVPRHLFVPPEYRNKAYEDMPLPIGRGQTISQPYIVALMTQALRLTPATACWRSAPAPATRPPSWLTSRRMCGASRHCPTWRSLHTNGCTAWAMGLRFRSAMAGWAGRSRRLSTASSSPPRRPLCRRRWPHNWRKTAGWYPGRESLWDQSLWLVERTRGRLRRELLAEVRFVPLVTTTSRDRPEDPALTDVRRELSILFGPRSEPRSGSGCS